MKNLTLNELSVINGCVITICKCFGSIDGKNTVISSKYFDYDKKNIGSDVRICKEYCSLFYNFNGNAVLSYARSDDDRWSVSWRHQ